MIDRRSLVLSTKLLWCLWTAMTITNENMYWFSQIMTALWNNHSSSRGCRISRLTAFWTCSHPGSPQTNIFGMCPLPSKRIQGGVQSSAGGSVRISPELNLTHFVCLETMWPRLKYTVLDKFIRPPALKTRQPKYFWNLSKNLFQTKKFVY